MGNVADLAYLAQPVYATRPALRVNGQADEQLATQLMSWELHECIDGLAALQLRAANWVVDERGRGNFAQGPSGALRLGVSLGLAFADQTLFDGCISAIGLDAGERQAPVLTVAAEDALMRGRLARRTKVYEQTSLAGLLQQLLGNLGLGVELQGLSDTRQVWAQFNESDLAFARRLLAAQDATLLVQGSRCWAGPLAQVPGDDIELSLGGQLREVQVQADLAQQCTQISVAGFDPVQGSDFQARSSGRQPGPGEGQRGDALLAQTLGARPEHLAGQAAFTQAEAQALADAAFDQRLRRFVTARGVAEGLPLLRAGTRLRLQGLGDWFSNRFQVVEVWHRFDLTHGYRTEFVAHGAFLGGGA